MPIHNVRYGFANNSSSTHSTLLCPDLNILDQLKDRDEDYYGSWAWFILKSKEWKEAYFFGQILPTIYTSLNLTSQNLKHPETFPIINEIIKKITNKEIVYTVNQDNMGDGPYGLDISINGKKINTIDHESQWTIPLNKHTKQIDITYCQKLYKFITQEHVIIRGGNDNEDINEIFDDEAIQLLAPLTSADNKIKGFMGSGECVVIHDNEMITIFNSNSGDKIRFSFEDIEKDEPILTKASEPELIDLNITDYCEENCYFCYRGCSKKGIHADVELIKKYIDYLKYTNVLEIAIGGGDVFHHPQLIQIMQIIRDGGIIPNITIHENSFIKILSGRNEKFLDEVVDICGSIAISPASNYLNNLGFITSYFRHKYFKNNKISFQIIPELFSKYEFERLLTEKFPAYLNLTLLGYKQSKRISPAISKRQEEFLKSDSFSENLLAFIQKLNNDFYAQINCDTTFVSKFEKLISDLKVSKKLYYTEEGKYSCYIDAVQNTISKSSYDSESFPIQTETDILKYYKTF